MLHLYHSMKALPFSEMMEIYLEGNVENGDALYPDDSDQERLRRAQDDFYNYLTQVFFQTPGAVYALWEAQGRFASALRIEPYRDGYLLEALETLPAYRRHGFAKALVEAFLIWAKENGKLPLYVHIRKGNIPSEKVHASRGFRILQNLAVYVDGSVDHRCNTWIYE